MDRDRFDIKTNMAAVYMINEPIYKHRKIAKKTCIHKARVCETTLDFMFRISSSYVPAIKSIRLYIFVLVIHKCCRSRNVFRVSSNDKTSLRYCKSFIFSKVFTEKSEAVGHMNYVKMKIG